MTCSRRGLVAQLVEHRTGIAEVMGSNPVGASEFFLGFLCNSYFTTVKITFTSKSIIIRHSCGLRTRTASNTQRQSKTQRLA